MMKTENAMCQDWVLMTNCNGAVEESKSMQTAYRVRKEATGAKS